MFFAATKNKRYRPLQFQLFLETLHRVLLVSNVDARGQTMVSPLRVLVEVMPSERHLE